jgi:hypothetical protein
MSSASARLRRVVVPFFPHPASRPTNGSILICERGLGGSNDCLPARQSAIFAFSAENSKIARVSAHFLEPEGTGEARIRPYAADFRYILSVENLTGALRTAALNRELRQDIAFSFGIEASASNVKTLSRS